MTIPKLRQGQILLAHLEGVPTTVRLVELWNPSPWQPRGALYVERPDHSDRRIIPVTWVDLLCDTADACADTATCRHCRYPWDDGHLLGCPHANPVEQPADVCEQEPFTGDLDPTRDRFELTLDILAVDPLPVTATILRVLARHGLTETTAASVHTIADARGRQYFAGAVDEHGTCFDPLPRSWRDRPWPGTEYDDPGEPEADTGGGREVDGDDLNPCDRFEMAVELHGRGDCLTYASAVLAVLRRWGFRAAPTAPVWTKPAEGPGQYVGMADAQRWRHGDPRSPVTKKYTASLD